MRLKRVLCLLVLAVFVVQPVFAKKVRTLSGKKYKTHNEKILRVLWTKSLKGGKPGKRYYPETSEPVLDNGRVFVGTQAGWFYAVSQSSGKILWKYENEFPIASTPCVSSGRVYFTDLEGHVIALNADTGELSWTQTFDREMLGKISAQNGKIFLIKGELDVLALSQEDGHVVWQQSVRSYVRDITMRGHAGVVPDGDKVYVGLADGQVYALNAGDGRIVWNKSLTRPLNSFKDVDGSVVLDGDSLYVGGYGETFARLSKSGVTVWQSEVTTGVAALILGNRVIVSDNHGRVVALDKSDGKQLWFNDVDKKSILSAPVAFGDKIFVGTYDDHAYLLNPDTGDQVQKVGLNQGALTAPATDGGQIVVLTNGGTLMSFGKK